MIPPTAAAAGTHVRAANPARAACAPAPRARPCAAGVAPTPAVTRTIAARAARRVTLVSTAKPEAASARPESRCAARPAQIRAPIRRTVAAAARNAARALLASTARAVAAAKPTPATTPASTCWSIRRTAAAAARPAAPARVVRTELAASANAKPTAERSERVHARVGNARGLSGQVGEIERGEVDLQIEALDRHRRWLVIEYACRNFELRLCREKQGVELLIAGSRELQPLEISVRGQRVRRGRGLRDAGRVDERSRRQIDAVARALRWVDATLVNARPSRVRAVVRGGYCPQLGIHERTTCGRHQERRRERSEARIEQQLPVQADPRHTDHVLEYGTTRRRGGQ